MSWSTSTAQPVEKDAITLPDPHLSDVVEDEQDEQFRAAMDAAKALAEMVGRPDDTVTVHLSGHANPEHAPRDGWAEEHITVTVTARPV